VPAVNVVDLSVLLVVLYLIMVPVLRIVSVSLVNVPLKNAKVQVDFLMVLSASGMTLVCLDQLVT
jgi:hypothetical protein